MEFIADISHLDLHGRRIIKTSDLVKRSLIVHPTIRKYSFLRPFKCYRALRVQYLKKLRIKYHANPKNWKIEPLNSALILNDGTILMHPTLYNQYMAHSTPQIPW